MMLEDGEARAQGNRTTSNPPSARQVVIGDFPIGFAATFVLLAVMAFRFAKREPTPPGLALAWPRSTVTYSLVLETIILPAFGLSWLVRGRKSFPAAAG